MSSSINLDGLSREDLLELVQRIEQRLLTFPVASSSSTENARAGFRDDGIDVDDPWATPCPTSTVGSLILSMIHRNWTHSMVSPLLWWSHCTHPG